MGAATGGTAALADVIAGLDGLAGPDGPSFELAGHDLARGSVSVRVVLDDAECSDCVLPPDVLAELVSHHVRSALGPDVEVVVSDPRVPGAGAAP